MQVGMNASVPQLDMRAVKKDVYDTLEDYKREVALRLKEILLEEFENEGTVEGKWIKLSPITVRKKGHNIILYETGELSSSPYAEQLENGNWEAGIRSSKFDPAIHEYGTGHVPARPMVGPATRQVNREITYEPNSPVVTEVKESLWKRMKGWWK